MKAMMIPEWMIIGAFRYYLGRATYSVSDCTDWIIKNNYNLDEHTTEIIVKEIREALEQDHAGMDIDRVKWREVLEVLE